MLSPAYSTLPQGQLPVSCTCRGQLDKLLPPSSFDADLADVYACIKSIPESAAAKSIPLLSQLPQ